MGGGRGSLLAISSVERAIIKLRWMPQHQGIQLTPNNAAAYTNRGNAKSALGQHQAAIADHTEALRLNPNLAAAYINRGVSNSLLGRVNEARRDFEKALALAREADDEDTAAQVAHRLADLNKSEDP